MDQGQVQFEGTPDALRRDRTVQQRFPASDTPTYLERVGPSAFLVVVCLVLWIPGVTTIPPIDRDEARYAQATHQMIEHGDYIRINFQNAPRYKKPAGIHWLQAMAVAALGLREEHAIWPYRLPSLAGGILSVLGTFLLGRMLFDRPTAALAAVLLASSVLLGVEARLATTDAMLLATVVGAQTALSYLYLHAGRMGPRTSRVALLFWLAIGAGSMIKGPVTAVVSGLTILTLAVADNDVRWLRPLWASRGYIAGAAIALPWMIAIAVATHGAFFWRALGDDLFPILVSGFEGHGGPPGYHAALLPVLFWPGSLFTLLGLPWIASHRDDPRVRFCLAWIIPTWVLFEAIPTKLPHYVLPAYPAIALLSAAAARMAVTPSLSSIKARAALLVWTAASAVIAGGLVIVPVMVDGRVTFLALVAAAIVLLVTVLTVRSLPRTLRGTAPMVLVGIFIVHALGFHWVLPTLQSIWLSRAAASVVHRHAAQIGARNPVVAAAGYSEPSLVFLLGTGTILTDGPGAASHLAHAGRGGFALVRASDHEVFEAQLARFGLVPKHLATIQGFNYSTWARVRLDLYQAVE